jgi:hypothetical protein
LAIARMSKKENPTQPPLAERRAKPRKKVLFAGVIVYGEGDFAINCRIRDLTETSARVTLPASQSLPEEFYLINMKEQTAHKARMVWQKKTDMGLALEASHDLRKLSGRRLGYLVQIWSSRNTVNMTWK